MQNFLVTLVVNMLSITLTSWLIPGITAPETFAGLLIVALVFGLINAVVRPILTLLSLPFIVITFGLFIFVLNALLFMFVGSITPLVVSGFGAALLGALVMGLINALLVRLFADGERNAD